MTTLTIITWDDQSFEVTNLPDNAKLKYYPGDIHPHGNSTIRVASRLHVEDSDGASFAVLTDVRDFYISPVKVGPKRKNTWIEPPERAEVIPFKPGGIVR